MRTIEKYSFGVGDRFAHQAESQLNAFVEAEKLGIDIVPVWNKSHREHTTIGSQPDSVRTAGDAAVKALRWEKSHYVDADHINLSTVDGFLAASDFFTIDVADSIGSAAPGDEVAAFVDRHGELVGNHEIAGIDRTLSITKEDVARIAAHYLLATIQAGEIFQHIAGKKGDGFVTEVSMDETDSPQTPVELLVILAAIADQKIPIQTIAPKFTGRFNKGVDYVGDIAAFETEFREDIAVLAHAAKTYGLPENLKLSVHSGSDKFSIYEPIRKALADTGAGLHIKTAGTTWLEELIGLAEAGGDGLRLSQDVYAEAFMARDALCAPYASVIDIDESKLPSPEEVRTWTAERYVNALRHDLSCPEFNNSLRQLLHVGYKVAATMGDRYLNMLDQYKESVARNVTLNLVERHMKPLFLNK